MALRSQVKLRTMMTVVAPTVCRSEYRDLEGIFKLYPSSMLLHGRIERGGGAHCSVLNAENQVLKSIRLENICKLSDTNLPCSSHSEVEVECT